MVPQCFQNEFSRRENLSFVEGLECFSLLNGIRVTFVLNGFHMTFMVDSVEGTTFTRVSREDLLERVFMYSALIELAYLHLDGALA